MIEFMNESSGNTIGIHASGKLTKTDYETVLIPKFTELFEAYGKLNLVFFMDDTFEGWDLEAAWDDASYGLTHRTDFAKLAVVGGPAWVNQSIKLIGFLIKGEIKVFSSDQLDQAWQWIKPELPWGDQKAAPLQSTKGVPPMRESKDISEIVQRVQAVETQLAEKLRTLAGGRTLSSEISAKADAIRDKSGELSKRLTEKQGAAWTGVKDELNHDLHALEGDFDHWVQYLDKHYKE